MSVANSNVGEMAMCKVKKHRFLFFFKIFLDVEDEDKMNFMGGYNTKK